jgi:hypothetical protein
MDKNSALLKKIENNLAKSPKLERIVTLFKSLLSLENFVEELSEEFRKVEEKIDVEYITTDEFAYLFEQCFKAVSDNYQKEKIEAFKAILVNATTDSTLIHLEKEFFLNLTKQLTVLHIQLLDFLHDTRDYIKSKNLTENQIQGRYKDFLPIIFPDIEFDTIKIALDDLNNYGLTELKSSQFGVITISSGLQLLGDRKTTSFGEKYLRFITL